MDKKKYFDSVIDFIDKLSDEEFDALLIESGIEHCPYEDFSIKSESIYYESFVVPTNSLLISSLKNLNSFDVAGDAA